MAHCERSPPLSTPLPGVLELASRLDSLGRRDPDPDLGRDEDEQRPPQLPEQLAQPWALWPVGYLPQLVLPSLDLFAYYYVISVSLPSLLASKYGMTPAGTGSALLVFTSGDFVGLFILNQTLDRLYVRLRDSHGGVGQPEYRLPIAAPGGLLMPSAILSYGWAAELAVPLPLLLLTITFLGFCVLLCSLPMTAYVVDAFGNYSASALTGLVVGRCLVVTFLPIAVAPLTARLGQGWGLGVLAALSLALAPIPLLILRYGPSWRMRSKYTKDA